MKYQVRDINKTGEIEDYRIKNFAYHFILKCDGFTTDKDDLFFNEEQQMLIFKTRKCFEKWFQRISYYVKVDKLISDLIHHKEENNTAEVKIQPKVVILNLHFQMDYHLQRKCILPSHYLMDLKYCLY